MAHQQPASKNGGEQSGDRPRSDVIWLLPILLGLGLILGAANNQPIQLSNQVVPEIPAPGGPGARLLVGGVGLVLLLVGLAGLLDAESRVRGLLARRAQARAPKPRQPPGPNVGRPPDRNPLFSDRELELGQLREQLERDRRVNLSGLGGVGKSSLTIEHIHRQHAAYPDGVFWLRGEATATLTSDFAALAWLLELKEREEPQQERVIAAVISWLRSNEGWLVIVDNLDKGVISTLDELLARGLAGHVLVTSRVPVWRTPLPVQPMPLEEATDFLMDRTRQTDRGAAVTVAEALGRLPLALEQAAAYIELNSDLSSYAQLLQSRLGELMQEGQPPDYPFTVASTWNLSFQQIERDQPASAALMRLCAFMAADDIPISLLKAGADELPAELRSALGDQIKFEKAIGALRSYSLIARQTDNLGVHRLVQSVIRESLEAGQQQRWLGAAVRLLAAGFPSDAADPEHWPMCARLLPHAQVVADLVGDQPTEPGSLSWLLDRVATYLQARAEFGLAKPLFERALAIRERVLGPDHPGTAASLDNLASLLQAQGELAAARPLFERALAITERVLGPDHSDTASSLNNLALLLQDQGELAAARPLYERALAIWERVLGPDHPDTAMGLNNLAGLLQAQGELAAARPLFERALAIRERVLGPDHPDTAMGLNNLAGLLEAQGELAAARPLYERALAIRERVLGPDHPNTATSLNNLAGLLQAQGELAAARPLLERALAIRERVLGPDHPDTASSLNNLALLLQDQGELAAARPLFERALEISERVLGPDHPNTASSLNNLALLLKAQGDLDAARPLQPPPH
jgi:tetratricopeptide (TPR) repeat protein